MPLRLKKDLSKNPVVLKGAGAFGTYLTGEHGELNGPWCLRLMHWRRESPNQDPSKGNGFATQFAICMACGCLPFGQSIGLTHVVHITEKTFEGIMMGQKIADQAAIEGDLSTGEKRATASCLSILPSANRKNYYRIYESKYGIPGLVYDSSLNKISTWPEVVARIAFGGLVPMAALNLVKAVRFTPQGF